ncbi:hypothetical protein BDK51DRAFT_28048 [Blyttiomyces helicus]|uniref:Uncharacterized protein n=1 Tax=Blyttiomyces helicus TaxID=388810 RepID=A0A4V1IRD1_9FUNG|nr:hypothetical protein BDK51DRAFT_28048 [Blyttiomyces helicus]|eukprot:RKO89637.1 hypothetical protein BDK51DRAFT_28048 [Blyttiomyces helicus]
MEVRDSLNAEKRLKETSFFQTYHKCMETRTKSQAEILPVGGKLEKKWVDDEQEKTNQEQENYEVQILVDDEQEETNQEQKNYEAQIELFLKKHYDFTDDHCDYVLCQDINALFQKKKRMFGVNQIFEEIDSQVRYHSGQKLWKNENYYW